MCHSTSVSRTVLIALALLLAVAAAAQAQQTASSVDALRFVLEPGERIELVDAKGQTRLAKFVSAEPGTLRVRIDSSDVAVPESDLAFVNRRYQDSLKNGLLIGTAVGIAVFVPAGIKNCAGDCAPGLSLLTLMSAGLGVLIDASVKGWRPVFERRPPSAPQMSIVPVLGPGRAGVALSWRY